jgi:hypothetical protein
MGEIGDNFIPVKKFFAEVVLGGMEGVKRLWATTDSMAAQYKKEAERDVLKDFPGLQNATKLSETAFEDMIGKVNRNMSAYQDVAQKNIGYKDTGELGNHFDPVKSQGFYNYTYSGAASDALMTLTKQARLARSKMPEGMLATGDLSGVPPTGGTVTPTGNGVVASDAKAIGSGSQTKSTVINIESFIKGFSPTSQSVNGMNKEELERWMTEMFMRVVRSAETTM